MAISQTQKLIKMDVLKELSYIVKNNRIQKIDLLDDQAADSSKVMEFFQLLNSNEFKSDDEAAQYFYNADKSHPAYQKLKATLKFKLVNYLFFIDTKSGAYTARQTAYYQCYKEWAAAKILMGKNARKSGVQFCHQILKYAKRFEFTDLTVDIAKTMRLHYGTREGNIRRFEHFNKLYKKYRSIADKEDQAQELYTNLVLRYVNSKATKIELHQKAKEYFEIIQPSLAKSNSYLLILCAGLIELMIYSSLHHYEQTIKVCRHYIGLFNDKKYLATVPLQIFYYQLLVCHVQLQHYEEGKFAAEKCLEFLEEGSFNWFKFYELYFILSMHTQNYKQAYLIYNKVVGHKRFKFLPENIKEIWRIYKAYLYFLYNLGLIPVNKKDDTFSKFRLRRFLNDIPIYSKDKRGMNIPVLIAHTLLLLQQKRHDEAIDRIETIEKYCARYLTKNDTFRSNCFIKLLLQIPISGFHQAGVVRRAEKYLQKLKTMPLDIANQAHEIEIIPYEILWQLALDTLDNKFVRSRKTR